MSDQVNEEPIKTATAALVLGGLKNKQGTLLLYPDRLVHVGANLMGAAAAGGAIGALIGSKVAKGKAAAKAAAGGKGVTEIRLADVTAVNKTKQGLNRNLLEVQTVSGSFRFGAKFDAWADEIAGHLRQLGRTVAPAGDGYQVS